MNDKPYEHDDLHDEPTELDAFEQSWVDELGKSDPELAGSADAFVQRVMEQHNSAQHTPAVAGRIGPRLLPYAVAAGLALALYIGWVAITSTGNTPDPNTIANNPDNAPLQPDQDGPVSPDVKTNTVQLGKLIAQAQSTVARPASGITDTAKQAPRLLTLDALIDLVDNPVPDIKELLKPLEPNNQQSRA